MQSMKNLLISIFSIPLLMTMCTSLLSHRDAQYGGYANSQENTEKRNDNDAMPDSVVRLLTVIMPDDKPHQLLVRKSYIASYNKDTRMPNWVAWRLTPDHADGPYERMKKFHEDTDVPAPRATPYDYKGCGHRGLSRGHMCPAGDNRWDAQAMYETFALTNICPQSIRLNTGLWNSIEMDCRKWARLHGDLYLVCGPLMLNREHETLGENEITVPEAFFKIVLCLTGKPKAFGFIVRNNNGTRKRDLYYNSIDQVERVMGYDFFSALPDDVENAVEAECLKDEF